MAISREAFAMTAIEAAIRYCATYAMTGLARCGAQADVATFGRHDSGWPWKCSLAPDHKSGGIHVAIDNDGETVRAVWDELGPFLSLVSEKPTEREMFQPPEAVRRSASIRDELDWMQTYTGKAFFPLDPQPEDLDIHDIAFGLARCCRFAGQIQRFYSVAEHAVHVSFECSPRHALEGLMHDAAEAYLGDLTRPVKIALRQIESGRIGATGRSSYDDLEDAICKAIAKRWKLTYPWPADVKAADESVLMAERRDLMRKPPPRPYKENAEASTQRIEGWNDGAAAREFLKRFHYLALERGAEITHAR